MSTNWITVCAVIGPSCAAVRGVFASRSGVRVSRLFERIEAHAGDASVTYFRKFMDGWTVPITPRGMFGYDGPLREVEESGDIFTLVSRPTRNGFLEHMGKVARRRHQFGKTGWSVTALKEAAASSAWIKCDDVILLRVRTVAASKHDEAIQWAGRSRAPWG